MTIYRGRIVGLFREKGGSSIGLLGIEDDARGQVLVPCDGNPTCRAFNVAFPGTLRDGRFHNAGIEGERIYYTVDEVGVLATFTPEDRAPEELIAEYEKQSAPKKERVTFRGPLPPDDPIYSIGPVVQGRRILRHTDEGLAKPDDPVYRSGPIVQGRRILDPPKRKSTDN